MTAARHFLDIDAVSKKQLRLILDLARQAKSDRTVIGRPMEGKTLAMIFDRPSTRTRVSFEVAAHQLGGQAIVLSSRDMQLGRGETVADTARVLSRYIDAIMIRTESHARVQELAANATVPVVNGLTDWSHPCQVIADLMTIEERRGPMTGKTLAWSGDASNVAISLIHAAVKLEFALHLACPEALAPPPELLDWVRRENGAVRLYEDPRDAVRDADAVFTDTWVSMGIDEDDSRYTQLEPFRVDGELMQLARNDALFLHCLPAHRGEEVTADVIDGPQSAVFDEAENRLHAQKAILAWCLQGEQAIMARSS